jgi:hypothetical protein
MGGHAQDRQYEVHDEDDRLDPDLEAARADEEIVHMRGAAGHIWRMALPLHPDIADQYAKGQLTRVNEDGTVWEATDDDEVLVHELPRDRAEREHLAALEYAELKRARPDEDPIVLRDEAAEVHGDPIPEDAPQSGGKPKPSASKADWVAYAGEVSDLSHAEADAMTKAQLVEKFG